MHGTKQAGIWSDRGSHDNYINTRTSPYSKKGLALLMQSPQCHQQPSRRTSVFKASSNSTVPVGLDYRTCHGLRDHKHLCRNIPLRDFCCLLFILAMLLYTTTCFWAGFCMQISLFSEGLFKNNNASEGKGEGQQKGKKVG